MYFMSKGRIGLMEVIIKIPIDFFDNNSLWITQTKLQIELTKSSTCNLLQPTDMPSTQRVS